ncbi:MAG: DUF3159 domain-containing protein [Bacillota bacterium]
MSIKRKEILRELRMITSGKTFDALLPPLLFALINGLFNLDTAIVAALGLAILLSIRRIVQRHNYIYALGGLLGVAFAAGLTYLTRSAATYFLPTILSSGLLLLLALGTLLIGKPLAAWASHLTRGWPLDWFWRKDVKPAYQEVTFIWSGLIALRLFIQVTLYQAGDPTRLAWINFLLGWPVILIVLVLSYLYGIWRLRQLGGPGVDEFRQGKEPPWRGQTRGF